MIVQFELERLRTLEQVREFTKSRSRRSNDNALAESKNASALRRQFGHGQIPQAFPSEIDRFLRKRFVPCLKFHRPCQFTSETVDARDKVRKNDRYSDMATPRGRLKSQPVAAGFLKPGVSFEQLDRQAAAMTDLEAVTRMNEAQDAIFYRILQQLAAA